MMVCKCSKHSPFRWRERKDPSIFMSEVGLLALGEDGLTISQRVSKNVEAARAKGLPAGYLSGVARDAEAERRRLADFEAARRRRSKR